jgi:hypothetical protein
MSPASIVFADIVGDEQIDTWKAKRFTKRF